MWPNIKYKYKKQKTTSTNTRYLLGSRLDPMNKGSMDSGRYGQCKDQPSLDSASVSFFFLYLYQVGNKIVDFRNGRGAQRHFGRIGLTPCRLILLSLAVPGSFVSPHFPATTFPNCCKNCLQIISPPPLNRERDIRGTPFHSSSNARLHIFQHARGS